MELTPQRGSINNNLELMWMEVDLAKKIPDVKCILHVGINDLLLNMDFNNLNHIGGDAVNRIDQFQRSPVNFSVWELSDISDPKRPFPRDGGNAHYSGQKKGFDKAFFKHDGKEITMKTIEDYLVELNHFDKAYNLNTRAQKQKNRHNKFHQGNLRAKFTDPEKFVMSSEDFELYENTEEAQLDAPIVIFAMAKMVKELRSAGIDVFWHFPGRSMMTRFFKQRYGGYNEVPKILRNMAKFKELWGNEYNVFDKLRCNEIQLKFCAPVNNQDGMQIPNKIRMQHGPYSKYNASERIKFKAYIENPQSDALNFNLVVMTGNHLFPLR